MKRLFAALRRKPTPEPIFPEVKVEEAVADPGPDPSTQTEGVWQHGVAFGADGWFHPMTYDLHGNETGPDLARKLIHNAADQLWEFATHQHRAHKEYWETKHPQGLEQALEMEG